MRLEQARADASEMLSTRAYEHTNKHTDTHFSVQLRDGGKGREGGRRG